MTARPDFPQSDPVGFDSGDLDGHTVEELSDYLDAGREPRDASIEGSPGCQLALDVLERLRGMSSELLVHDAARMPDADPSWVDRILSGVALDVRSGRRLPLGSADATVDLGITEGAVRGVVRSAENAVPGLLLGRCRFHGDLAVLGAPIRIEVEATVFYGQPVAVVADRLREEIGSRVRMHTEIDPVAIDVVITDVQEVSLWTAQQR